MLRGSLLGNLGADPEVRFSATGMQIVSFRVAVNQVRTGPDGERQENTEWFRVRVSGKRGDFVQRLQKGARVLVIGRLDIGHYQAKDGESRTSFDVWADDVQAMSSAARTFGPDSESAGFEAEGEAAEPALSGANGRGARSGPSTKAAPAAAGREDLEDLP